MHVHLKSICNFQANPQFPRLQVCALSQMFCQDYFTDGIEQNNGILVCGICVLLKVIKCIDF